MKTNAERRRLKLCFQNGVQTVCNRYRYTNVRYRLFFIWYNII